MKKLIIAFFFCLNIISSLAQIKIFPGGNTSFGSTSSSITGYKFHFRGQSVFSSTDSAIQSAAFISGRNLYSSPTTPDYTWYPDTWTGLFHPSDHVIGFSVNGSEGMRLSSTGQLLVGTSSDATPAKLGIRSDRWAIHTFCYHSWDWDYAQISEVTQPHSKNWAVIYNTKETFSVFGNGEVWSQTSRIYSDSVLKENVTTLTGAKNKVLALRGVSFNYRTDTLLDPSDTITVLPSEYPTQIGLIAQEVERVVPEVVSTDSSSGLKAVAYSNLAGLFVEAFKEQQASIDSLHGVSPGTCEDPATLTTDLVTELDTNNIYYSGQDSSKSRIGIGYTCSDPLLAKFSVNQSAGGTINWGLYSEAANGSTDNIGIYTVSGGGGSGANYGVYASAPIGGAAIFCSGDLTVTGSVYTISDGSYKTNVVAMQNGLQVVQQLLPKYYQFDNQNAKALNVDKGSLQAGFIAAEVKAIPELSHLVKTFKALPKIDSLGHYNQSDVVETQAVNYVGIIPYLVQSIKTQQQQLDSLTGLLTQMQSIINNCCQSQGMQKKGNGDGGSGGGSSNGNRNQAMNVELDNANSIILNQNDPNPFGEQTTITYNIPDNVKEAKIIFFDNLGRILKTMVVNERGAGQLNVFASNLSSGIYSYSLLADGQVVATKKMVKSDSQK